MKFKGTIVLAVVFLATIFYFFFVDLPGDQKKGQAQRILLFEEKNVREVVIEKKDQTLVMKRRDSGWAIVQPVQSLGSSRAIEEILSTLKDAQFIRSFDEDPSVSLASYGLQDPVLKVTLKLKDRELTLLFGGDTPIESSIYLKRTDQSKIFTSSLSRWLVDRPLSELRDKVFLPFSIEDVTKVHVKHRTESFQFIKKGEDWMFQSAGVTGKSLPHMVKLLLDAVNLNRVVNFIDENTGELKTYGLDNPAVTVTIFTQGGVSPQSLLVGDISKNEAGEDEFYAKTDHAQNVFTVHKKIMESLSLEGLDFLDRTLMTLNPVKAIRLQLKSKGEEIHVSQDQEDKNLWKISQPIQAHADQGMVISLLQGLHDTKIRSYVKDPKKDMSVYGLDPPQKELTVFLDDNQMLSLKIGKKTENGRQVFIAWPDNPSVVALVNERFAQKFSPSVHELMLKKLLVFKEDDVGKIRVQYPKRIFELERKGQDWNLLQPTKIAKIAGLAGQAISRNLRLLEFDSLADPALSPKITGLDKPATVVTVWNKNDEELVSLLVGKPTRNRQLFYVRIKGKPTLYLIPAEFLAYLRDNLKEILS